jgi:arsenite-transporting ATPase
LPLRTSESSGSRRTSPTNSNTEAAFEFFAGKGGVGKTTCAAARAVDAARNGERVLVVSTDPAHSLGDALGVRLSSRATRIGIGRRTGRRTGRLEAIDLDARRAFGRWLRDERQALGDVLEHGTWLDRADVEALLALPIPGVDELVGMLEIVRQAAARGCERVVVDTAPTGHTLRLLASPEAVAAVSGILASLHREHRLIREQLARVVRPEAADRLIDRLAGEADATSALLRDRDRTLIHWVTTAEELSLAEMADGLAALTRSGIPVADAIVNRLVPDGPPCPVCDRQRSDQRAALARWRRSAIGHLAVRTMFEEAAEPQGTARLAALGARLRTDAVSAAVALGRRGLSRATGRVAVSAARRAPDTARRSFRTAIAGASLLFFGGKGGVGKTTAAAASALMLARESSGRVLLLSTDPAHSLGDVLGEVVGAGAAPLKSGPPNLDVWELDAAAALASRRVQIEEALREIVAAVGSAVDVTAASDLIDLAPAGLDELVGILSVIESRAAYEAIVIDTAPTGHALRLLEMPDVAREWLKALLRVLLKYRDVVRPGQLAAELVELSKSVRRLQDLLRDGASTRFVIIARAAELPRRETIRLLRQLRKLRLATPAIVVNARRLAPGRCPRCRASAKIEEREVEVLARACGGRGRCAIIQAPLAAPAPRGPRALAGWADAWMT